jgi:hypothetical protein
LGGLPVALVSVLSLPVHPKSKQETRMQIPAPGAIDSGFDQGIESSFPEWPHYMNLANRTDK